MEGALVGGFIAQVESEAFVIDGAVVQETESLQKRGAVAQPVVLGHALDQDEFGTVFRAVFIFEIHDELVEFYGAFPGEEDEHAASIGEPVDDVVLRRCGLTLARRRTAGELCIGLISCDLRFGCHSLFLNAHNGHQTPCALGVSLSVVRSDGRFGG